MGAKKSIILKLGAGKMKKARKELALDFGFRVKKVREYLHFNQTEFAGKIGVSNSNLCEIELGKKVPGLPFLYQISQAFKINPLYLIEGKGQVFYEEYAEPQTFLPVLPEKKAADSDWVEENDEFLQDKLELLHHSPLLKYATIQFIAQYYDENEERIEAEIQKRKKRQLQRASKTPPALL
jgi:transcriptional regulator with XRE-family HTH domain